MTGWWRSISLRAKVTGVAVAVLAIGLLGAGILTTAFLREALASNVEENLREVARTDFASQQFEFLPGGGTITITPRDCIGEGAAPGGGQYICYECQFVSITTADVDRESGDVQTIELSRRLGNRLQGLPFTVIFDNLGKRISSQVGEVTRTTLDKQLAPLLPGSAGAQTAGN